MVNARIWLKCGSVVAMLVTLPQGVTGLTAITATGRRAFRCLRLLGLLMGQDQSMLVAWAFRGGGLSNKGQSQIFGTVADEFQTP